MTKHKLDKVLKVTKTAHYKNIAQQKQIQPNYYLSVALKGVDELSRFLKNSFFKKGKTQT